MEDLEDLEAELIVGEEEKDGCLVEEGHRLDILVLEEGTVELMVVEEVVVLVIGGTVRVVGMEVYMEEVELKLLGKLTE